MKSNPGRESILDVGASVTTADGDETSKGKSWSCPRIEGLVANVYGKGLLPSWEIFNDSSTHNSHGIPKVIALVAGHCIDPGYDTGAPGEREQSKRIADMSSRMLKANGWKILRPDRDARHLTWLEYNDWINQRTREGIPVIEIHGQGKCNGVQGKLTGVIGQRLSLLNKELAKTFGYFPTNWRRLRVARNGGTVLEAFNTDRLKRMSHGERIKAAHNLAAIIAGAVVQAESASTSTADNAVYNGCSLTGCPRE